MFGLKFGGMDSSMKNIHITMTALFAASGMALLPGCMMGNQYTPPTSQQLAAVGYGAPLTIDYKKAIPAFFFDKLKDPLSAQYLFDSQPQQWWTIDYIGGALHVGYAVTFQMNSKNSYGGYIGFRKWLVLLRDNQIVSVTYDGNPWSQEFYTGSVSEGFKYGNYNPDQKTLQFHQSYHGTEFQWPTEDLPPLFPPKATS
jgi:hypothetical protein